MKNPYEVLGVPPYATEQEIKDAYRKLAKKYHPDGYENNPLSDLAREKMQEINWAYDTIITTRREKGFSNYSNIRNMIAAGRYFEAEQALNYVPKDKRNAEWYFLMGSLLYKKGWFEEADRHFKQAYTMDPNNPEYVQAFDYMRNHQSGPYRTYGERSDCDACTMCETLLCLNCLCNCCSGDGCC